MKITVEFEPNCNNWTAIWAAFVGVEETPELALLSLLAFPEVQLKLKEIS